MTFLVEHPVDFLIGRARRVLLDLRHSVKIVGNETAQMIRILGRIRHYMSDALQPLDQTACLRTITPLAGGDNEADRQTKCIDRCMDFRGQTTLGTTDCVSFSPPF